MHNNKQHYWDYKEEIETNVEIFIYFHNRLESRRRLEIYHKSRSVHLYESNRLSDYLNRTEVRHGLGLCQTSVRVELRSGNTHGITRGISRGISRVVVRTVLLVFE